MVLLYFLAVIMGCALAVRDGSRHKWYIAALIIALAAQRCRKVHPLPIEAASVHPASQLRARPVTRFFMSHPLDAIVGITFFAQPARLCGRSRAPAHRKAQAKLRTRIQVLTGTRQPAGAIVHPSLFAVTPRHRRIISSTAAVIEGQFGATFWARHLFPP